MPAQPPVRRRTSVQWTRDSAVAAQLRRARQAAITGSDGGSTGHTASTATDPSPLDVLVAQTAEIYARALSDKTRADYQRRWKSFSRWCTAQRLVSLPAEPETVMLYLAASARGEEGASLSTLRGRLASINRVHLEAGMPPPGDDPAMSMLMRGLGRVLDRTPRSQPISALRITDLRESLRGLTFDDPIALRDRSLLLLHHHGLTDMHLSHLTWQDVRHLPDGSAVLSLRDHLSGPVTTTVTLPASEAHDAAEALRQWRTVAGDQPPHVFTCIDRYGRRERRHLHPSGVRRILDTRMSCLGPPGVTATPTQAARLLDGPPSIVLRDRALLLVGFAGAFRRPDLTGLTWRDIVREEPAGIVLLLRRSKTDVAGRGKEVGIPRGRSDLTCPVRALLAWRTRVQDYYGDAYTAGLPFLPGISKAGRISTSAITPEGLTRVVKVRAEAAGLDGHWGGRSLRAGFISTAAELDLPMEHIARQSRHKSLDQLMLYIRADPLRRSAADRVGL